VPALPLAPALVLGVVPALVQALARVNEWEGVLML